MQHRQSKKASAKNDKKHDGFTIMDPSIASNFFVFEENANECNSDRGFKESIKYF